MLAKWSPLHLYHLPQIIPKATSTRTIPNLPCRNSVGHSSLDSLQFTTLDHSGHPCKHSNNERHHVGPTPVSSLAGQTHQPHPMQGRHSEPSQRQDALETAVNPRDQSVGSTAEHSVCSLMCPHSRFWAADLHRNHRSHGLRAPSPALQSHLKLLIKGAPNIILPWVPTASVPSTERTAGTGLQEVPAQPEQNTQQVFTSSVGPSHDLFPVDQKQAFGERFTLSCQPL